MQFTGELTYPCLVGIQRITLLSSDLPI